MRQSSALAICLVLSSASIGCGTDEPTAVYPSGPYGFELGDVLPNITLRHPDGELVTAEKLSRGRAPAVLFYVTATWCFTCGPEIAWLNDYTRRLEGEVEPMSVLLQNQDFENAEAGDAEAFSEGYGAEFPTVLDPNGELDVFRDDAFIPLNVLVDASTMRITLLETGFDQASLEGGIDAIVNGVEDE